MISLKVLGGLDLRGADGQPLHSVLSQPKRQALLVYLAVAQPIGFHRRDTLLGLLWPDLADANARASLSRAVHYLRQSLDRDVVVSRGHEEIGLDHSRFWCDAAGFISALDDGRLAEGVALYRGELLPGFFVDDAPEFQEWLESERTRFRNRAVEAAQQLSEREESAGNLAAAVVWSRRAVALSPLDETAARRLIGLLDASGDRGGALQEWEDLVQRMREQLDASPSPETEQLVDAVKARRAARALAEERPVGLPPARREEAFTEPGAWPPARQPAVKPRATRVATAFAMLAALAIIVIGAYWSRRPEPAARSTVAVTPFVVQGDSTVAYLARGIVSLLSEELNHGDQLHAVDPRTVLGATAARPATLDAEAARAMLGALHPRFVVSGSIVAVGDSMTITATLHDSIAPARRVWRARVRGRQSEIRTLVAGLAAQLLLTQPTNQASLNPTVGSLSSSLDALKAYLAGEQAYASGHFEDAARHYRAAVNADSTFALAYLWLSRSASWTGDLTTMSWAAQRALELVDRLAPLHQLRVRAWDAYLKGRVREAEELFQTVLANDEGASDASQTLGELRYHWGPLLGWTQSQARAAFERSTSMHKRDVSSLIHIARIVALEGNVAAFDSVATRANAAGLDPVQSLELTGMRAFLAGDRTEENRVIAAIDKLDDAQAYGVAVTIIVSAAVNAEVRRVASVLTRAGRSAPFRTAGALLDAQIAAAHGDRGAADVAIKTSRVLPRKRALEYRAALAAVPFANVPATELRALRDALAALPDNPVTGPFFDYYGHDDIYGPRRAYLLGMLHLKLGDSTAVQASIRQLRASNGQNTDVLYARDVANLLSAELLHRRGRDRDALATLGEPNILPDKVLPSILAYSYAHERFLRAEILRELGEDREALRWYETFPDPAAYDLMYLPVVYARRAEMMNKLDHFDASRLRALSERFGQAERRISGELGQ